VSTYRSYVSEVERQAVSLGCKVGGSAGESNPDRWVELALQLGLCLSSVADYHYGASANSRF